MKLNKYLKLKEIKCQNLLVPDGAGGYAFLKGCNQILTNRIPHPNLALNPQHRWRDHGPNCEVFKWKSPK